jgi:hypothetical protein
MPGIPYIEDQGDRARQPSDSSKRMTKQGFKAQECLTGLLFEESEANECLVKVTPIGERFVRMFAQATQVDFP